MSARKLPVVIATEPETAAAGIRLIAAGEAWAVVYAEDVEPGVVAIRTWIGAAHLHRQPELDELVKRTTDLAGFSMPARGVA